MPNNRGVKRMTKADGQKALSEAGSIGTYLEAKLHTEFTEMADGLYSEGKLTREERITLSSAIGDGLSAFIARVNADAPQIYQRALWEEPEGGSEMMAEESARLENCVRQVMAKGSDEGAAWGICRASLGESDMPPEGVSLEMFEFARSITRPKQESDAGDLSGDFVPLVERSVRNDGTIPLKIIAPGWGSSGYYPAHVLERDGPNVFTPGVKMFWDHPTRSEEAERPERSIRDLAAELVAPAKWNANGPAGPGLYAEAKTLNGYKDAIDELAPHIGVSIRAMGRSQPGNVEGKAGQIITEITSARSVDFVTTPGAGGQILSIFEARRGAAPNPPTQGVDMDELQKLQETNAQLQHDLEESRANLARLQEMHLLREAGDIVAEELAGVKSLPDVTRARLARDLSKNPPVKDGKLDKDALKATISEAVKAETEYLAAVLGAGKITNMGGSGNDGNAEADHAALVAAYKSTGLSEAQAEIAANGR